VRFRLTAMRHQVASWLSTAGSSFARVTFAAFCMSQNIAAWWREDRGATDYRGATDDRGAMNDCG
jgi:hypothetical protein